MNEIINQPINNTNPVTPRGGNVNTNRNVNYKATPNNNVPSSTYINTTGMQYKSGLLDKELEIELNNLRKSANKNGISDVYFDTRFNQKMHRILQPNAKDFITLLKRNRPDLDFGPQNEQFWRLYNFEIRFFIGNFEREGNTGISFKMGKSENDLDNYRDRIRGNITAPIIINLRQNNAEIAASCAHELTHSLHTLIFNDAQGEGYSAYGNGNELSQSAYDNKSGQLSNAYNKMAFINPKDKTTLKAERRAVNGALRLLIRRRLSKMLGHEPTIEEMQANVNKISDNTLLQMMMYSGYQDDNTINYYKAHPEQLQLIRRAAVEVAQNNQPNGQNNMNNLAEGTIYNKRNSKMKQVIRLTESDIHRMVMEAINEIEDSDFDDLHTSGKVNGKWNSDWDHIASDINKGKGGNNSTTPNQNQEGSDQSIIDDVKDLWNRLPQRHKNILIRLVISYITKGKIRL